jgi:predicted ATPase
VGKPVINTVLRFGSPGCVVLLDEPELHQHRSLMRGGLAALERLVVERLSGQLIVASHAPEVWDHLRGRRAWEDLEGRGP